MPLHNADIAVRFRKLADLLEIGGANEFHVRTYRNAASTVAGLPCDASAMVGENEDLCDLPGIGEDLAGNLIGLVDREKLESFGAHAPSGQFGSYFIVLIGRTVLACGPISLSSACTTNSTLSRCCRSSKLPSTTLLR